MKPSVIIDQPNVAAEIRATFTVARGTVPVAVYCHGLAGAEYAAVEFLAADIEPTLAVAGDWAQASVGGELQQLTEANNMLAIYAPGEYSLRIPAAAGPIKAGLY